MLRAKDIMDRTPRTVDPNLAVKELADLLLNERLDGVCVCEGGRLMGVVTAMDLIFQEKPVHLPSFFLFLDAMIPLESRRHAEQEFRKITGARVADIMTTEPRTVDPDTPLDEIARLMVDEHFTLVPVVEGDRLVGVIDKPAMLRVAFVPTEPE